MYIGTASKDETMKTRRDTYCNIVSIVGLSFSDILKMDKDKHDGDQKRRN